MGFLNPLFLLVGAAVAVPLLLHLLQRHEGPRVPFPALRYLRRAEERHAFRIRLRQLLLLVLRVAALLVLVAAGARPYLAGRGGTHLPTAVAIVLDNSMSTGVVQGEFRFYDRLQALALTSAEAAGPDDRIWVLRAAEPWEAAVPGGAATARERILATSVVAARADLGRQLARASELVRSAGLPGVEVHLLSDLQRSALGEGVAGAAGRVATVAYFAPDEPPPNRAVTDVVVASGLSPRALERSHVAATITSYGSPAAESTTVRLALQGQVRAAHLAPAAGSVILPLPPLPAGLAEGYVEIDADALRADDRRFFAFAVRPPPRVATTGAPGPFLIHALAVLEQAGQLVTAPAAAADVVVAGGGLGPAAPQPGAAFVVVPPADPVHLPELNRRLGELGIPWRYGPPVAGQVWRITTRSEPGELRSVEVFQFHRLESTVPGTMPGHAPALLESGEPWMVEGTIERGPYLLLASPLLPEATALPVTARMVPFVEWIARRWAARSRAPAEVETGHWIPLHAGATAVAGPDGTRRPVRGTESARATAAGVYHVLHGDSVAALVAANPPAAESDLQRVTRDELDTWLGEGATVVTDTADWRRAIYAGGRRLELGRALVALAALLLVAELWIASAGRHRAPHSEAPPLW